MDEFTWSLLKSMAKPVKSPCEQSLLQRAKFAVSVDGSDRGEVLQTEVIKYL